jgi:hypothetical protein
MKKILYWGGVAVLGVAIGLASVAFALKVGNPSTTYKSGPWFTTLGAGNENADMYTRARVALFGLLALNKEETMYYRTGTDSAGETLSGSCTYVVEGRDLPARWWAITAYAPDNFLIPNDAGIYSFAKTTVKREADGHYIVRISSEKQEGYWLPVKAGENFDLTARFYNPEASVYAAPQSVELPTITREGCK